MTTKAILSRRVSVERTVTVAIPDGLTAEYLVAALNAENATEVGKFLIFPGTFAVAIEGNEFDWGKVVWDIVSAEQAPVVEDPAAAIELLKKAAETIEAQAKAEEQRKQSRWQIGPLNQQAFDCVVAQNFGQARRIMSAATLLYELSGGGDSNEAVMMLSIQSFIATGRKHHQSAWKHGKLAIEMARRLDTPTGHILGMTLANIGEGQVDAANYVRAEKLLLEAVEVLDKVAAVGADHLPTVVSSKAEALRNLQRIEEQKVYAL